MFGIATSIELFEKRLSRSTVGQLQGRRFGVQDSEDSIDLIFQTTQKGSHKPALWLGHNISNVLLEKSKDYFQSPESFGRIVQVSL
jgi:origin recognition complex subunit 3